MSEILLDFAANEVGWNAVLARLVKARTDYLHAAARADGPDHLVAKGRLEGIEKALSLIEQTRQEIRKEP